VLLGLARNAMLILLVATGLTIATYPLAYRRLMIASVESGAGPGRHPLARLLRGLLIGVSGTNAETRAAADFFTATIGRVERHRFVLAMALGVSLTWVVAGWKMLDPPVEPAAGWLSLPLSATIFFLTGLAIAASLPGDVRAAWVFDISEPSRRRARHALERTMFLIGVLPPTLLALPVFWTLWGRDVALLHAAVSLTLGAAIVELLIWHCNGMPCARRWNLSGASLGYRWPLYVAAFFVLTTGVPRLELLLFRNASLAAACVALLIAIAAAARHASAAHAILPRYDDVDPVAGVLRLE
jgi:hypothetical protein